MFLSLSFFYLYPIQFIACNAAPEAPIGFMPRLQHKAVLATALTGRCLGDARVFARSKWLSALVALPMAVMLCGCSSNFDTSGWFARPVDLFGTRSGYTYSNLGADTGKERPITANDLVDANGACPAPVAGSASPPPAPPQAGTANADGGAAPPGDLATLFGGGVAIGMSECEVVGRLGAPNAVNLGKYPNGLRSAILTFNGGPRPGIYRFEAGRLTEMDRVDVPAPAPEATKKKVAKKKPVKTQEPAKTDNKT